jgi:flagellar biogenesis protein FliO
MQRRTSLISLLGAVMFLVGLAAGLGAQQATEPSGNATITAEEQARAAWRARWVKQWKAEQARLAAAKKSKASALTIPPPVEDTLPSLAQPSLTPGAALPSGPQNPIAMEAKGESQKAKVGEKTQGTVGKTEAGKGNSVAQTSNPNSLMPDTAIENRKSKIENPNTSHQPPATNAAPAPAVPAKGTENSTLFTETRPDAFPVPNPAEPVNRTQDNPFAAVGDSGRMILYLVPLLVVLVGGMHLMRRFYEKTGRLPQTLSGVAQRTGGNPLAPARPRGGLLGGLIGGLHLHNARQTGGSNIRTVESIPLGSVNLHLIEVRGRLLLLGATGGNVSLLAEWEEKPGLGSDEFKTLLHAAAADMDGLNLSGSDWPARAIVGTLEEEMRDTGQALTRRARRLRTVLETEADQDRESETVV